MEIAIVIGLLIVAIVSFIAGMRFERTPLDDGPWSVASHYGRPIGVESDDPVSNVVLHVNGDFEHRAHKQEYCEWLTAVLNKSIQDKP